MEDEERGKHTIYRLLIHAHHGGGGKKSVQEGEAGWNRGGLDTAIDNLLYQPFPWQPARARTEGCRAFCTCLFPVPAVIMKVSEVTPEPTIKEITHQLREGVTDRERREPLGMLGGKRGCGLSGWNVAFWDKHARTRAANQALLALTPRLEVRHLDQSCSQWGGGGRSGQTG